MTRLVLFDLDGTLVDTAPELSDALNATLASIGIEPVAEAQVRQWIGDGARALLARALAAVAAPPGVAPAAWDRFSREYAERCGQRSTVHAGVRPMLARLRAQGQRLAVLTNKEGRFAHRVLAAHDLLNAFDLIVAGDTLPVKKPHPDTVGHALATFDLAAEDAVLVGDSATDVRTARAAGIPVWLVRHGYPGGTLTGADAPDGFIAGFEQWVLPSPARLSIA
jgi:phosphoglycolate phosphatase